MTEKKSGLFTKKNNVSFWNEKWVEIPFPEVEENPPHYRVSNYGRIKSFQNDTLNGEIINGSKIQGYKSLNIRAKGKKSLNRYVHKLVAEFFVPKDIEDKKFVLHLDYDKLNNYWENIRWATREEMTIHNRENPAVLERVIPRRTKNYKLTESKVIMIKKMLRSEKNRLKMIAKQFGITHTQLNRIRSGENWGHVKLED
jgi:DNA-binding Xre family transcriptional regulator